VSLPCLPSLLLATVPTACSDSCSALADAWVSAFFDDRAIDLPHKLYQTSFSPAFVDALPSSLRPVVDWCGGFVAEHGDSSFWVYGVRRSVVANRAAL